MPQVKRKSKSNDSRDEWRRMKEKTTRSSNLEGRGTGEESTREAKSRLEGQSNVAHPLRSARRRPQRQRPWCLLSGPSSEMQRVMPGMTQLWLSSHGQSHP